MRDDREGVGVSLFDRGKRNCRFHREKFPPDCWVYPPGRKIRIDVHARGRFVVGKMAERWDRADFEDIKRQLTIKFRASYDWPL